MSDDELKTIDKPLDNFAGYDDRVEGDDRPQGGRLIQGTLVKFTNDSRWIADDEEIPDTLELVVIDVARLIQKWKDQSPVETIFLEPGQKFPNVNAMNEQEPRSEWREGADGKKVGPWQKQHVVYLLHLETMRRFTYPTGTTGGSIAVSDMVRDVNVCRRFRGANQYAVITLDSVFMKTRFGGRQRPDLVIRRFIAFGPDHKAIEASAAQPRLTHQDPDRDASKPPTTDKRGVQSLHERHSKPKPPKGDFDDPLNDL